VPRVPTDWAHRETSRLPCCQLKDDGFYRLVCVELPGFVVPQSLAAAWREGVGALRRSAHLVRSGGAAHIAGEEISDFGHQ
jgi:hypothetical protein